MIPNSFRFVNRMMNIVYMTGQVRHNPDNPRQFFIQQTANPALDVPIELPPDFVRPPAGQLRTVIAHVRGRTSEYGQTAVAEVISVQQSSIINVNPMTNFLLGYKNRLPKDAISSTTLLYNSAGQLKEEYLEQLKSLEDLSPQEKAIIELYEEQTGKMRGRFDTNSNVVLLAGVVDRFSYVPPNAHQRHGQGMILLRQHKNLNEMVPVRLVNNKATFILEKLRRGAPVMIKGRLRRKIMPTPDGSGILSDLVLVETDMISPADQTHILPPPPAWYVDYLKRDAAAPAQETATAAAADEAHEA